MTDFPNFGLINQMSKHIANNASPRILDYQSNGSSGYMYAPTSTDLISQATSTGNSISQQQRFNAIADQLIYGDKLLNANRMNMNMNANANASVNANANMNNGTTFDLPYEYGGRSRQQESVINTLIKQQPTNYPVNNVTQNTASLNQTAEQGVINDNSNVPKENFSPDNVNPNGMLVKESQNKLNIIGIVIICFILFMLIQLYLSQKKLEFMMNIYKPSRRPKLNDVYNTSRLTRNELF